MKPHMLKFAGVSLFSTALLACTTDGTPLIPVDGTGTGNPNTGIPGEEATSGACTVTTTRDIATDEATSLGFSAAEVLAFVAGTHKETLTWNPQQYSYEPEHGAQALDLTVAQKGTPRFVEYTESHSSGIELALAPGQCGDAIEIDADITMHTAGGALDETLSTTLLVRNDKLVRFSLQPVATKLKGSLAITPPAGATTLLYLDGQLTPYGTSGTLRSAFETRTSDSVSMGAGEVVPLAQWGSSTTCERNLVPVPRDAKVAGFSGDDMLTLFNATTSANLTFQGGAPSKVLLSPLSGVGDHVCARLEPGYFGEDAPVGEIEIAGTWAVKSDDGRIDAQWPVLVSAKPSGDGFSALAIVFDFMHLPGMGSVAQKYGVTGVDISGVDDSAAQLSLTLAKDSGLTGTLKVNGWKAPNCPTGVTMDANGGASSPACPGSTAIDLATGTFSR
jgi:hypothetical protein